MVISISREKVMGVVEGLSVILSHKGDSGFSFEQLWASKDERLKLDIYYRESISDLEGHLMKWLKVSSDQFSLNYSAEGDYTLSIVLKHWPSKLEGLLGNKVQDYMVHSILAGWLNNFAGLQIKQDYATIASQDLDDIRSIVMQKTFCSTTSSRNVDTTSTDEKGVATAVQRHRDAQATDGAGTVMTEERHDNDSVRMEEGSAVCSFRKNDGERKDTMSAACRTSSRKKDFVPVYHHREETDWSGEGIDELTRMMVPGRPHTVIIREPVHIPSGRPLDAVMRPCEHRLAPFEMPLEDPNEM